MFRMLFQFMGALMAMYACVLFLSCGIGLVCVVFANVGPDIHSEMTELAESPVIVSSFSWFSFAMLTGALLVFAMLFVVFAVGVRILLGGRTPQKIGQLSAEEARVMQEIYHGLTEMEKRIETIETIVLERPADRTVRWTHASR